MTQQVPACYRAYQRHPLCVMLDGVSAPCPGLLPAVASEVVATSVCLWTLQALILHFMTPPPGFTQTAGLA